MSTVEDLQDRSQAKPGIYETWTSKSMYFSDRDMQSKMNILRPYELQFEYTKIMMGFLLHNPQPRSMAMIGLGGGSLAKFCYRYLPQTVITVIEINPHVIACKDEFFVPNDDDRFTVKLGDAAEFLKQTDQKFDVLIADGFDIDGIPAQLSSQQFYEDCHNVLNPGGMFVSNLHGCNQLFDVFLDRIHRGFLGAVMTVDDPGATNRLVFAVKDDLHALRSLASTRRPKGFDEAGWKELVPSMARVFLASRALAREQNAVPQG